MNPLIPSLILVIGAVSALAGFVRAMRAGAIAAYAVLLASIATLMMGVGLPSHAILSQWAPETIFPTTGLRLAADAISWLVALALLISVTAVCLPGIGRRTSGNSVPEAVACLLVTAIAITAVFAENLVTLAVGWTGLAACSLVSFLALAREPSGQKLEGGGLSFAVLRLGVDLLASMLVLAAALHAIGNGSSEIFTDQEMPSQSVLYLFLGAGLRLNLYPFPNALRLDSVLPHQIRTILRLAAIATAVDVLAVIAQQSVTVPLQGWLSAGVLIAGLLGAWLWWTNPDPRHGLMYFFLAQSGLIALTVLLGGEWSIVGVVTQGLALLLGGCVLFLYHGFVKDQMIWIVAPFLAVVMIVGLPLTIGYLGMWALHAALPQTGWWIASYVTVLLIQTLLVAGSIRWAMCPGGSLPVGDPFAVTMQLLGFGIPLILCGLIGVMPGALVGFVAPGAYLELNQMLVASHGLSALGGAVVACGLGAVLWRLTDAHVLLKLSTLGSTSVLHLDWFYGGLRIFFRFTVRILQTAGTILEGQGGVLWALVAAFIVWLTFG